MELKERKLDFVVMFAPPPRLSLRDFNGVIYEVILFVLQIDLHQEADSVEEGVCKIERASRYSASGDRITGYVPQTLPAGHRTRTMEGTLKQKKKIYN
jgi:hypothetical protein